MSECLPVNSLASAAAAAPAASATKKALGGYPTVGKFFFDIAHINLGLSCTATVINDPNNKPKNASQLVLTAAQERGDEGTLRSLASKARLLSIQVVCLYNDIHASILPI